MIFLQEKIHRMKYLHFFLILNPVEKWHISLLYKEKKFHVWFLRKQFMFFNEKTKMFIFRRNYDIFQFKPSNHRSFKRSNFHFFIIEVSFCKMHELLLLFLLQLILLRNMVMKWFIISIQIISKHIFIFSYTIQ